MEHQNNQQVHHFQINVKQVKQLQSSWAKSISHAIALFHQLLRNEVHLW